MGGWVGGWVGVLCVCAFVGLACWSERGFVESCLCSASNLCFIALGWLPLSLDLTGKFVDVTVTEPSFAKICPRF